MTDDAPEPPAEQPENRRAGFARSLAFLFGGLAMIFIGWVWGRATPIDGVYGGAVVVAGIAGALGGLAGIVRVLRR